MSRRSSCIILWTVKSPVCGRPAVQACGPSPASDIRSISRSAACSAAVRCTNCTWCHRKPPSRTSITGATYWPLNGRRRSTGRHRRTRFKIAYWCPIQAKLSSCGAARHLRVPQTIEKWCQKNLLSFWANTLRLENAPYSIPSEDLRTIVQQELNEGTPTTSTAQL